MDDLASSWYDIFELIWDNLIFPLNQAISMTNSFAETMNFINSLLNGILNLFREVPINNLVLISPMLIADLIGLVFLIVIIIFIAKIISFVIKTLKVALIDLINNKKRKVWRKQWKRS